MRTRRWHLLVGTDAGPRRARLIRALDVSPANANQLAERLDLNYNTVRDHLRVLGGHGIVVSSGDDFGELWFLTEQSGHHREVIECIAEELVERSRLAPWTVRDALGRLLDRGIVTELVHLPDALQRVSPLAWREAVDGPDAPSSRERWGVVATGRLTPGAARGSLVDGPCRE